VETTGPPKFLGDPNVRLRVLDDSGESVGSRPSDAQCVDFQNYRIAPATGTTKALTKNNLSKLNHTAFGLAVYASSHSLPHATQDSLPAVGQTLPDGLSTRRVTIKGFRFTSCQSSSFAKLLGAIPFFVKTVVSLFWIIAGCNCNSMIDESLRRRRCVSPSSRLRVDAMAKVRGTDSLCPSLS